MRCFADLSAFLLNKLSLPRKAPKRVYQLFNGVVAGLQESEPALVEGNRLQWKVQPPFQSVGENTDVHPS